MKKLFSATFIFSLLFALISNEVKSQSKKEKPILDTGVCLEVTGKFDESMKHLEGNYTAQLIRDNKVVFTQTQKVSKPFKFILKKNMQYSIKIEKKGYIYKLISISTNMPSGIDVEEPFKFTYETNMISEELYHNFDDDDMDFPMALVGYGKKCDCFEYDKKYTAKLIERIVSKMLYGGG